jgi:radical SAM superfamily enzyme YgiQ (UPF0313 family)
LFQADRGGSLNILLISPKGPLYRHRGGIFKKSLRYQPLTLTTLAAYVPVELDAKITLVDEGIQDVDLSLAPDLVGLTVITGSAMRAYELAAHFRGKGSKVVLGGPHVTLAPGDAAPYADAIVVGYAEDTWPQLLRDLAQGKMQSRYQADDRVDLAGRPFARRDLLPSSRFLTDAVFEATRGCVHDCDFCVVPAAWGRRPYQKPVAEVCEDIRRMGQRKIIFVDLNLIADRSYAMRLFEGLIGLDVSWFGLSTVLLGNDDELLALAARSGCSGLLMGLESIDPQALKLSRKGFNSPDAYAGLVEKLHRHGITLMGCFVFGSDHDGPETFMETARFAVEAGIDLPRFAISTPFPGTALNMRLEAEGRILTRNWELYDGQHVVFQPRGMGVDELYRGHEAAWKHAYRYSSILRRLGRSRQRIPITLMANLGYRFYAHHLRDFYNCDWIIGQREPIVPKAA